MVEINNQDLKNKFKIYKIVKNHFSLTDYSLKLFKYRLFLEPHIAPEYSKIIKDSKDLRKKILISDNLSFLSKIDKGWETFINNFRSFCKKYPLSYEDFKKNKVTINSQQIKLQKAILNFYINNRNEDEILFSFERNFNEYEIKNIFEIIGSKKIGNKNKLYLVLSLNFADWFLCSTKESWTSCLNLDSDYENAYWTGLPGLIGDKNRALVYLTDGTKKEYEGIIVDKIISRSWILTVREKKQESPVKDIYNKKHLLNFVKSYPLNLNLKKMSEKLFNLNFTENNFISRYYLENIFYDLKDGIEVNNYIYQDSTLNYLSRKNKGKIFPNCYSYLKSSSSGINYFYKNGIEHDSEIFLFSNGLTYLIQNKTTIKKMNELNSEYEYCYECNTRIHGDYICENNNGELFCENCYNSIYSLCNDCSEEYYIEDLTYINSLSIFVCSTCFCENYFYCEECDTNLERNNQVIIKNDNSIKICEECADASNRYFYCDKCNEYYLENKSIEKKVIIGTNEVYCNKCYEKIIYEKQELLLGFKCNFDYPFKIKRSLIDINTNVS